VAVCAVNCTVHRRIYCSYFTSRRSIASYSSRIAIFLPHAFDAPLKRSPSRYRHKVRYAKTRWFGCPKNFEDMFIRFDGVHERDGQMDGRTDTARRHSIEQQKRIVDGSTLKVFSYSFVAGKVDPSCSYNLTKCQYCAVLFLIILYCTFFPWAMSLLLK